MQNKLGIVFEKEKDKTQRKDFVFVSARVRGAPRGWWAHGGGITGPCGAGGLTACPPPQKREAFCQLLQLMKNKHSHQDEPDMISIFIGTWNMGERGHGSRAGGAARAERGQPPL